MIRLVAFDFDGTLVESNEIKRHAYFHIAARYAGEEVMADVVATVAGGRHEVLPAFARLMAETGLLVEAEEIIAAFNEYIDAAVVATPEVPGASGLLADLRAQGIQLHLSSGTPRENLLEIIRRRGWIDMFDGIHGYPTTKTETLRKLCRREGFDINEVAVVGDGIDDAEAADNVGCLFLPVGCGSYHSQRPDASRLRLDQIGRRLAAFDAATPLMRQVEGSSL